MKPALLTALAVLAVLGAVVMYVGGGGRDRAQPADASPAGERSAAMVTHELRRLSTPRPVPAIRFTDASGHALGLGDFRGRVVLLNVWATWCGPCRREMPSLDRLQAKLGGPDFLVLPLSIDEGGVPAVTDFYQHLGIRSLGTFVDRSGDVAGDLHVVGVPSSLLIDREGREVARLVGPAEWDSTDMLNFIRGYLQRPVSARGRPSAVRPEAAGARDESRVKETARRTGAGERT